MHFTVRNSPQSDILIKACALFVISSPRGKKKSHTAYLSGTYASSGIEEKLDLTLLDPGDHQVSTQIRR